MSYKSGIDAMSGNRRKSASVHGIIQSKSEVFWYLDQTDSDIDAFKADVERWSKTTSSGEDMVVIKEFAAFVDRWKKFYSNTRKAWHGWGDQFDQINSWRERLVGWRKTFVDRGMKPTTPSPQIPRPRDSWLAAVMIAAGGALLGNLLTEKIVRRR